MSLPNLNDGIVIFPIPVMSCLPLPGKIINNKKTIRKHKRLIKI